MGNIQADLARAWATAVLAAIDQSRRGWGKMADALGLGPQESAYGSVFTEPGVRLRDYGADAAGGQAILIIPAPIKGPWIWDLAPQYSVVQRCLQRGWHPFMIEWLSPGGREQGLGLADYADRLINDCLDAISRVTGCTHPVLMGHSLGGTLATFYAALHPDRAAKLVLLGAPLHFGREVGAIDTLLARLPAGKPSALVQGNVPGALLSLLSGYAAPRALVWERWLDWINCTTNREAMRRHLQVERWSLDERPLARRLAAEVVTRLYRQDQFMQRRLKLAGRPVLPERVRAPLLSVLDRRCTLVPPRALLPFHHQARSRHKQLLWYRGDTGVSLQHVGMLVGPQAHQTLWPRVLDWIAT